MADPFGLRGEDCLHVFVESYDYRTRHGVIERLLFDGRNVLVDRRVSLREPWHLSYPFVFEGEGAIWMLPEAHRSGRLTLYRAHRDLDDWRPECVIDLDCIPVDASILNWQGRWWLFYSSAASKTSKLAHLHVAWAENLCGPWVFHPKNPVRIASDSARPGGKPIVMDGRIMLPVQDCSRTYGGAIRPLWIDLQSEIGILAEAGEPLAIPSSAYPYSHGMHTLTACGPVTLIDCKRIDRSLAGLALDLRRAFGRYAAR
uniref:glucosamine inositolphosphorylceramide transferase family protein n=1 Tax=Croceicoccus estronivorus TaxID=1172626 RepID=UPI000B18143F|nr:formyl transferase [Croceicoccus estronivorus]